MSTLTTGHIYVSRQLAPDLLDRLSALELPLVSYDDAAGPTPRELFLESVRGATAMVVSLTERVDAEALDAAGPSLRLVANVAVGTDNIDVAAADARGVLVTNTPDVLTEATADLAMGLLLAVQRRIAEADAFVRSREPWAWAPTFFVGEALDGATLGIVGYGRIGQAMARRARAFGMRILASPGRSANAAKDIEVVALSDLLRRSDVVSLHCPLNENTRHLIAAAELELMKPSAALVNTARGPIVDESALVRALQTGVIRAAGLDVYEQEPNPHPGLLTLPNVVLTPHIGSADAATRRAMAELAVANVLAVLRGGAPLSPVRLG